MPLRLDNAKRRCPHAHIQAAIPDCPRGSPSATEPTGQNASPPGEIQSERWATSSRNPRATSNRYTRATSSESAAHNPTHIRLAESGLLDCEAGVKGGSQGDCPRLQGRANRIASSVRAKHDAQMSYRKLETLRRPAFFDSDGRTGHRVPLLAEPHRPRGRYCDLPRSAFAEGIGPEGRAEALERLRAEFGSLVDLVPDAH